MCEYCGCQAVTAIADLTAEHEAVVDLAGLAVSAVRAGDPAAAADVARRIAQVLVPHTAVEERGLFPALAGEFGAHVDRLVAEHREFEAVLEAAPDAPAWPGRLVAALARLREHILAEQDGAFPAALASLSPEQWDAVDDVRAQVGSALGAPVTTG